MPCSTDRAASRKRVPKEDLPLASTITGSSDRSLMQMISRTCLTKTSWAYQLPRRLVGEGRSTIGSAPRSFRSLRVQRIVSTFQFGFKGCVDRAGDPSADQLKKPSSFSNARLSHAFGVLNSHSYYDYSERRRDGFGLYTLRIFRCCVNSGLSV